MITLGPAPAVPPPPPGSIAHDVAPAAPRLASPWRWRVVTFHPAASYAVLYGDGIQARPGQPLSTTIHHFAGGLTADVADHWSVAYAAIRSLYSHPAFRDIFDQSASLSGGTTFGAWRGNLFHSSGTSSVPLVETASQTRQEAHTTVATVASTAGRRFLFDLMLQQKLQSPEAFATTRDWPAVLWIHYQAAPRFDVAVGAAAGYTGITPGPDLRYRRPQLQLTWRPSDRLSVQVSGGRESRSFLTTRATTLHDTVYSAAVNSQLTRTTLLTAAVNRDLAVSYFSREVSANRRLALELRQRVLQHFQFSAGVERNHARYVGPLAAAAGLDPRGDRRRALNLRLATTIRTRGTLALSYQRNQNDSNVAVYRFVSHQYAADLGFRF